MLKTVICIALLISLAQGSSLADLLKRLLDEEDIETKGVYRISRGDDSISGMLQVDINDCPKPADGCTYVVVAKNTKGSDVQTQTKTTSSSAVTFTFNNLASDGVYSVRACMSTGNGDRCGPKTALCDMQKSGKSCSYDIVKSTRAMETRGVMRLSATSNSITGKVQVDINDCPKPYDCDYDVLCKNAKSGDSQSLTVNTLNSATRPFTCTGLSGGVYDVTACKTGSTKCGPRIGQCDLDTGTCRLTMAKSPNSISKKRLLDKNAMIDKIAGLLEQLKEKK